MKIIVAENSGFCSGVECAINIINKQLAQYQTVYTLGSLIHNQEVVQDLQARGAKIIDHIESAKSGDRVLIRSHGVGKRIYDYAQLNHITLIDATCPFVVRIHEIVSEYSKQGYYIYVVGDAEHPEVQGIVGWVSKDYQVLNSLEEAREAKERWLSVPNTPHNICVVAQTTIDPHFFDAVLSILKDMPNDNDNIVSFNTICAATRKRQKEASSLAKKVDRLFVIGGKNSSNTLKLVEICKKYCKYTIHLTNASDLALEKISVNDIIGVVAGASTPKRMIMEVVTRMNELEKNTNEPESTEVEGMNHAAQEELDQGETNFADELEKTLVQIRNGQVLTGTIVQIVDDEVCVNIGYKSDGFIPKSEFSSDPEVIPSQLVKVGDEIEVEVLKVHDGEGNVLLSHKNVEIKKAWEKFMDTAEDEGKVFDCVCKEIVKGGVITLINGIRAFVPASHVSTRYVENLNEFVGQPMRVKVIEVDKAKRRVVASQKVVLIEENAAKKKELWGKLHEGDIVKGIVRRLTDFGAFVDIGGIDGLIHVTELAWGRVKHPSDVVNINDEIDVIILSVDEERQRVSLGYKQLTPRPWSTAAERYPVGATIEGRVVRIVPFGAFVSIEPTIDGLVHISQVSTKRIAKVEDELAIGNIIRCKVLGVDPDAKRISLSRREVLLEEMPEQELIADPNEESSGNSASIEVPPVEAATTSLGDLFASANITTSDSDVPSGEPVEEVSEPAEAEASSAEDEQAETTEA